MAARTLLTVALAQLPLALQPGLRLGYPSPEPTRRLDHRKQVGGTVVAFEFSPDGKLLASAGADGRVILWEVASGKPTVPALSKEGKFRSSTSLFGPGRDNGAVSFSPDGKRIVFNGYGRWLVWDVATGRRLEQLDREPGRLVFCPDGLGIVLGEDRVLAWDIEVGTSAASPEPSYSGSRESIRASRSASMA